MTVAIEGTHVEIQLASPAANIFGFEHAPADDEQKQAIIRAEEILSEAAALFEFEGTTCQVVQQSVDLPFADELTDTDHADQHTDEHDEHDEHVEVTASYIFECDQRSPTSLNALILGDFPAIESLETQWISDVNQGAMELTADQPKINFR